MSGHLIAASVGSPHDFIASGRRARDIWFGSHVLASLTRAVAMRLRDEASAIVIVPMLDGVDDDIEKPARNSNQIIAWLPAATPHDNLGAAREAAEAAMQDRWDEIVERTYALVRPLVDDTLWKRQTSRNEIDLYFAAVWWTDDLVSGGNYAEARRRAMRALASHKLQRPFRPNPSQLDGETVRVPKSSLDGVAESVLVAAATRRETQRQRLEILTWPANRKLDLVLRLRAAEELDALGLMKRAAFAERLPSVTGMAVDPWIRGIRKAGGRHLERLLEVSDLVQRGRGRASDESMWDNRFRHDGAMLLEDGVRMRVRDVEAELDPPPGQPGPLPERAKTLRDDREKLRLMAPVVRALHDAAGVPNAYYVVISADGDGVGELIDRHAETIDAHRALSQLLTAHAGDAVDLIRRGDNNGEAIYAGGEDLLALLPLDRAFDVVIELAQKYTDRWKNHTHQTDDSQSARNVQTLSVGIAIAHCLDAFDVVLQAARDGERAAKEARRSDLERGRRQTLRDDGTSPGGYCTVHWMPRQGADVRLTGPQSMLKRMLSFARLHRDDQVSDAIGYRLLRLSAAYDGWASVDRRHDDLRSALPLELARQLLRRSATAEAKVQIAAALESIDFDRLHDADVTLRRLGHELVLSRRIAHAMRQAEPSLDETETT